MNHKIYKIAVFSFIFLFLSCNKNIDDIDINGTEHIGEDKISKLEIGVNSSVLDADGKAELRFKVKCKYKYNDKEFPLLEDRIPMDKIEVYASTGEKFNIKEPFTTKNIGDIGFYCKFGNITSNVVSVTSVTPIDENYTPIVIPIQVYVQYAPDEKAYIDNITEENFQKILDRANKIFAGKLVNAPSSTDSKITFKLIRIVKKEAEVESRDMGSFIYDNFMEDTDKYLTFWITGSSSINRNNCIPQYTIGNPDDIPGIELEKTGSTVEINTFLTEEVNKATSNWTKGIKKNNAVKARGIILPQSVFFSMLVPRIGGLTFESIIGKAYGLLPTGDHDEKEAKRYINGDLDYCPDTFSYYSHLPRIEKVVFIPKDKQNDNTIRNFYDSYNIMDNYSTSTTISRDQIKRIRQVIKDCPFRQMKL